MDSQIVLILTIWETVLHTQVLVLKTWLLLDLYLLWRGSYLTNLLFRFSLSVCNNSLQQMTVVDAYICGKKFEPSENQSVLPPKVASLLIEGIAQNTTGSVFLSEVVNRGYLPHIFNYKLKMHVQFLSSHKYVMHLFVITIHFKGSVPWLISFRAVISLWPILCRSSLFCTLVMMFILYVLWFTDYLARFHFDVLVVYKEMKNNLLGCWEMHKKARPL